MWVKAVISISITAGPISTKLGVPLEQIEQ